MLRAVQRAECDHEGCDAQIEFEYRPRIDHVSGRLLDPQLHNSVTGWYLSLKGKRTANMTFCPEHAKERHE